MDPDLRYMELTSLPCFVLLPRAVARRLPKASSLYMRRRLQFDLSLEKLELSRGEVAVEGMDLGGD